MDPQRQYAQLLTLWSQGSKMFRRAHHTGTPYDAAWEWWWRLGRRLVERGLTVLPVPLEEPAILVALDGGTWFSLIPDYAAPSIVARGHCIVVQEDRDPIALAYTGEYWAIRGDVALSLGLRGWRVLAHWKPRDPLRITTVTVALTLLGALDRHPQLFRELRPAEWPTAAMLMRHPGHREAVGQPLPAEWGFGYDPANGLAWWQRQDEDSVRSASRSPGGGAPGGRGVNV